MHTFTAAPETSLAVRNQVVRQTCCRHTKTSLTPPPFVLLFSCFLWLLCLLWWVHYSFSPPAMFSFSLSPPRGIAMHMPGVDRGTEKPVECLRGSVEEYTSVCEREWEFFSLLCLLFFYPPCSFSHVFIFPLLHNLRYKLQGFLLAPPGLNF